MKLEELSLKRLTIENLELAKIIDNDGFKPDIIVYIEKGGYIIGRDLSNYFSVIAIGIHANRKGNKIKKFLMPIAVHLPRFICNYLRKIELKSSIHTMSKERNVFFSKMIEANIFKSVSKILIVDDSVDTGYSIKFVRKKLEEMFVNVKDIRVAALNVWTKSFSVVNTDYYLWKDTIIITPMSKDSKEYKIFLKLYDEKKE